MTKIFMTAALAVVMFACGGEQSSEKQIDTTAAEKVDTTAVKADTAAVKADTSAVKADSTK